MLEIHHIATGRGDATLAISPSGRLALIDAGAVMREDPAFVAATPNASRSPGAWIAEYVEARLRGTGGKGLDAIALTHFHDDHVGGVPEVVARVPVTRLLDRSWPDYDYPPFEGVVAREYAEFAREWAGTGREVARLVVGTTGQVLADEDQFAIRTVAASGRVWTGGGSASRDVFPAKEKLSPGDWPSENSCSAALLISYGKFRYFNGGDLTDWADAGTRPWMNALTAAARACGPVSVAVAPHHGMFDALAPDTVRALRPKAWIISAWHAAHPSIDTLERMLHPRLYPGPRRVYTTALHPAAALAMRRLISRIAPERGHVIVRASSNGDFTIAVHDPTAFTGISCQSKLVASVGSELIEATRS